MKKLVLASVGGALLLPIAAFAKEKPPVFVQAKIVKDAPAVVLDPMKAYILLRTPGALPFTFSKVPTVEDQAVYEKLRAAAFEDAKQDYAKKLKRWEEAKALAAKTPGTKVSDKPLEPTETNFRFAPFAQLANFSMGPFNRFSKKDGSVFLHAVTPGTYRLLGQTDPMLGGGLCYCMGSVSFVAEAGKITDLGTLGADPENAELAEKGDSSSPRTFAYALKLTPLDKNDTVDPRLALLPRVPANYRAAGKMPNFYGIGVSRLPEIPGVLGYDRDRVLDLAAIATEPPKQPSSQ